MNETLVRLVRSLPQKPGVYLMRDATGRILYVGKAKRLRARVQSYFRSTAALEPAKQLMVPKVASIDTILARNEVEALILECSLIKQHRPPYNIIMRDDKQYQYLEIDLAEPYPAVVPVRRRAKRTARYFGPYTSGLALRRTLRLLQRLFGIRTVRASRSTMTPFRRNLERALGTIAEDVTPAEYHDVLASVMRFLRGDARPIVAEVERRMRHASASQRFELAATYRDQREAIRDLLVRQEAVAPDRLSADVIGLAREGAVAVASVLAVRIGVLIGSQRFPLTSADGVTDATVLSAFLDQYYADVPEPPKAILLPFLPGTIDAVRLQTKAAVRTPQRGRQRRLLDLARTNALEELRRTVLTGSLQRDETGAALRELAAVLKLPHIPRRIETYDISNVQGRYAVGSMVVAIDGRMRPSQYRRFRIRTVHGSDDPRMMAEVLQRRTAHLPGGTRVVWPAPDLIVLDGGMTQLNAVSRIFAALDVAIPLVSLAKREELVFRPGTPTPVRLDRRSSALRLLQRGRDEAHRFAITYYRTRHREGSLTSLLDTIEGIGPVTKRRLLDRFGSVDAIRQADLRELTAVISAALARRIRSSL